MKQEAENVVSATEFVTNQARSIELLERYGSVIIVDDVSRKRLMQMSETRGEQPILE